LAGLGATDLVPPPSTTARYLPEGMAVEPNSTGASELRILVIKTNLGGVGRRGFGIARFSLSTGQPPRFVTVNVLGGQDPGIIWGSGILDWFDGYTYVYGWKGVSEPVIGQRSFVARTPRANLLGGWQFWDGTSWTTNELDAKPLTDSNGQAIPAQAASTPIYKAGRFVMLTVNGDSWIAHAKDPNGAPRGEIQAWTSPTTSGPWSGPINVYSPPEAQEHDNAYIYNVAVHPELSPTDPLLVSYNVNYGCETGSTPAEPQQYRPRFIRVPVP
jgi:hypothetical protein